MSLLPLDGAEREEKEGEGFAGGEDDLNIKLNKYKVFRLYFYMP